MAKQHIALLNIHGFVSRIEELEFDNKDTGGQVIYVLNLAKALSQNENISKVDIITRRITLPPCNSTDFPTPNSKKIRYWTPVEHINEKLRIIRVGFTPSEYIEKEKLWSKLPDIADRILEFYSLRKECPDVWYGHFVDGGIVSQMLSSVTNRPFVWTPHSLEKLKCESNWSQIRIDHEYFCAQSSDLIVTSSLTSKNNLVELYNCDEEKIQTITPGVEESIFNDEDKEFNNCSNNCQEKHPIWSILKDQNILNNRKIIMAAGRAVEGKNFHQIISLFTFSSEIREKFICLLFLIDHNTNYANLIRNLISENNLQSNIIILPPCNQSDLVIVMKMIAKMKGILIHPSERESFGLIVLEGAACGLPALVNIECENTTNLVDQLECGYSVNIQNKKTFEKKVLAFTQIEKWKKFSKNARENSKLFTWKNFVEKFIEQIQKIQFPSLQLEKNSDNHGNHYLPFQRWKKDLFEENPIRLLISDFDGTIFDSRDSNFAKNLDKLRSLLSTTEKGVSNLVINTGRHIQSVLKSLDQYKVPYPKCIINSVGTEINYWDNDNEVFVPDQEYKSLLNFKWNREKLDNLLYSLLPHLTRQPDVNQTPFKIAFWINDLNFLKGWKEKKQFLLSECFKNGIYTQIIQSGQYLDFIPIRASKGNAVRYLSQKLEIAPWEIIVSGDSMNDFEMLNGSSKSIVVANRCDELFHHLTEVPQVYFAEEVLIDGVVEGVQYWINQSKLQSQEFNRCPYCEIGAKHNCSFLCKEKFITEDYDLNLLPVFQQISVPSFMINDLLGDSYAMKTLQSPLYSDLFFHYENFYLYPDPKMGEIENLDRSTLKQNGFWFVSWWVHPDLLPFSWWTSIKSPNIENSIGSKDRSLLNKWHPSASKQSLSDLPKPKEGYLHSIVDVMKKKENRENVNSFILNAKQFLQTKFDWKQTIYCLVHFPVSALYSTFHIHFVTGEYFENFERSTAEIGRVISLDHLPDNFDDLSYLLCEFHPLRLILKGNSTSSITDKYEAVRSFSPAKKLCVICGELFCTFEELKEHCSSYNHFIKRDLV